MVSGWLGSNGQWWVAGDSAICGEVEAHEELTVSA